MGFNCGIVGLPNVGKSTLFNALTATAAAQAANFPFCTIEPNVGRVAVPDARLDKLAEIGKSAQILPTQLEFVDIAGLVKGASTGAGLGNKFLANIRETDAILHVVRCFEDGDITHVDGNVDPLRDIETIETELMIADLESIERQLPQLQKKAKGGDKDTAALVAVMEKAKVALDAGHPIRSVTFDADEHRILDTAHFITDKPQLYVCNVEESSAANGNAHSQKVFDHAARTKAHAIVISAAIESEIAQLPTVAEKTEFLDTLGLHESGLDRIIRAGYDLLGLQTYFTVGPKEARAWTITKGTKAPQAAGKIHSDFERGFIRAEVIAYDDYVAFGGEQGAKEHGKARQEGKEYTVADGDVMLFRFNV